jgi:predicted transcriptional regulator
MSASNSQNRQDKDLSELEREVMTIIWQKGRASSREIKDALDASRPLALTTILTVLSRLRKKNYIAEVTRLGRAQVFKPLVPLEKVATKRIRGVLKHFFSGSPSSLVSHLLDHESMDDLELMEIRRLLEEKMNKKRGVKK